MKALTRFEELVEKIVEGSLLGVLGAQLQPVELARRLGRAMDEERTIGVGKAFAPNEYVIYLNPEDLQKFEPIKGALQRELAGYVSNLATEKRLVLLGQPSVRLEAGERVGRRQMQVEARLADRPTPAEPPSLSEATQRFAVVRPVAPPRAPSHRQKAEPVRERPPAVAPRFALRGGDATYPLERMVTHVGRALDNDLVLEDPRVSRYHAEIRLELGRVRLRDLASTNGTFVNGERIGDAPIGPDDVVSLGGLELVLEPAE